MSSFWLWKLLPFSSIPFCPKAKSNYGNHKQPKILPTIGVSDPKMAIDNFQFFLVSHLASKKCSFFKIKNNFNSFRIDFHRYFLSGRIKLPWRCHQIPTYVHLYSFFFQSATFETTFGFVSLTDSIILQASDPEGRTHWTPFDHFCELISQRFILFANSEISQHRHLLNFQC